MKAKNFSIFALSLLALMFLASGVSAIIVLNPTTQSISVIQGNSGSFTFTINAGYPSSESNLTNISSIISNLVSGSNILYSSNIVLGTLPSTLAAGSTSSPITITINVPDTQAVGTYNGTITIDADRQTSPPDSNPQPQILNISLTVISNLPSEITTSNNIGNPGNLDVKKIDFTNNGLSSGTTFGEDAKWLPFENIDAEIQIKNNGNDDINNIEVDWGIWDTKNHQWVIEMNDEKDFDLKDGNTKILTVSFSINDKMDVDLTDLTDGDHYKFYVTATGEVDNDSAPQTSKNDFKAAQIVLENNFVIIDNFQVPETVSCGKTVTIAADVWNIGDEDQDSVSVNVYNKDLGINQKIDMGDIDAFDKAIFDFDLKVPSNADEKTYPLTFTVYNEDNDLYQNDFNDDESVFTLPVAVKGSCVYATADTTEVTVNKESVSGGKAGAPMALTVTVKNTGDKTVDYTFNLEGYSSWASLSDLSPSSISLAPGESQEVAIILNVDKDASGQKTFNFETYSNGYLVTKQPLSATVESGFSFASITGGAVGSAAPLIIGLFSVVLVVLIVIVLVKIAKK
jgi:hypothetical protein